MVTQNMNYTERFSAAELAQVINESLVYMCACPAQVARGGMFRLIQKTAVENGRKSMQNQ